MKATADDVMVNVYYIHLDYFLSCIPINGTILKLEGSFVIREVCTFYSYNITRFVPAEDCYQNCVRNNTRIPGELCEESIYGNYEQANKILVKKLQGSRDTLQDVIDQIDQNVGSLPKPPQTSEERERRARFPNRDSGSMDLS
jgi:hypothetical protein